MNAALFTRKKSTMPTTPETAVSNAARAVLAEHKGRLAAHQTAMAELHRRANEFGSAADVIQPAQQRFNELQAQRPGVLAGVALGRVPRDVLDKLDAELGGLGQELRSAAVTAEVAAAGAAALRAEAENLNSTVGVKLEAVDRPIRYAAGLECVREALAGYRKAMEGLRHAHGALAGACLAADQYADPRAQPPRYFVTGVLAVESFDCSLPALNELGTAEARAEWVFNVGEPTAVARAAVLGELSS
jgi:hypothetical protein